MVLDIVAKAAVISALVFAIVFVGLVAWQRSPPSPKPPQQQYIANERQKDEKNAKQKNYAIFHKFFVGVAWFIRWLDRHNGFISAIGTLFVALFTGVLVIATVALFYSSEKVADAAKTSADAAKQSADAIANVERPYLFITAKPSKISVKDGPAEMNPTISYSFLNLGRVPAVVRLVYDRCFLAQQLNPNPTYSRSKFKTSQSAIGAGSTLTDLPVCEFEEPLTDNDWADIKSDKTGIVFMAVVLYEGALDYTYSTAITYKIDPFTGYAFAIGGSAYNNEQSERGRVTHGAPIPLPNIVP